MVTGDGRPCNFQCWKLPWEPTTLIPRWWQLKDFWNFHPEIWGNDPIWRTFLKGVETTNQLFSWFWGPRVGDETSNMFLCSPRSFGRWSHFDEHIFQVGCSCSCRTLSSWLTGNDLEPGYSKRKKPPYEILRSGDERSWEMRFPRIMERKVPNVSWGNLRHPDIQNSFLEEKSGSWGSTVTHTGGTFDLQNGMTWDDYYDSYSESVARHSTSWEGFGFSNVLRSKWYLLLKVGTYLDVTCSRWCIY